MGRRRGRKMTCQNRCATTTVRRDDHCVGVCIPPCIPALVLLLAGLSSVQLADAGDVLAANRASRFSINCACKYQAGAVHANVGMVAWSHLGSDCCHEAYDALVPFLCLECLLKLFIVFCAIVFFHVIGAALGNTLVVGLYGLHD